MVCRHAGPSGSVRMGAMTLTSWARQAAVTRSLCRSSAISRLPTTTASVTVYSSSITRGATAHSSATGAAWKRDRYQTFHSSNESMMRFRLRRRAPTLSAVDTTLWTTWSRSTDEARKLPSVAVELLVVGVAGDEVDRVVGGLQHRGLPAAERGHRRAGTAAGDQLDVGLGRAQRPGRRRRQAPVLLGGLLAGLPRAVHFVAQAPHPDAVRLRRRRWPGAGPTGACHRGWFAYSCTSRASWMPRVPRFTAYISSTSALAAHRANSSMPTWLVSTLCQARSRRRGRWCDRADAVLPAVAGDEVAARVADHAHAQLPGQRQHVGAEAVLIGGGVPGLEDSRVDTAAHVLHEGPEQTAAHRGDHQRRVEGERRDEHP